MLSNMILIKSMKFEYKYRETTYKALRYHGTRNFQCCILFPKLFSCYESCQQNCAARCVPGGEINMNDCEDFSDRFFPDRWLLTELILNFLKYWLQGWAIWSAYPGRCLPIHPVPLRLWGQSDRGCLGWRFPQIEPPWPEWTISWEWWLKAISILEICP